MHEFLLQNNFLALLSYFDYFFEVYKYQHFYEHEIYVLIALMGKQMPNMSLNIDESKIKIFNYNFKYKFNA